MTRCAWLVTQGPPGTGKTTAILGIVSVLLAKKDIEGHREGAGAGVAAGDAGAGAGARVPAAGARPGSWSGQASDGGRKPSTSGAGVDGGGRGGAPKAYKAPSAVRRFQQQAQGRGQAAPAGAAAAAAAAGGRGTTAAGVDAGGEAEVGEAGVEPEAGRTGGPTAAAARQRGDQGLGLLQRSLDALVLGKQPPMRVLLCAQSNGAIDELMGRLATEGVWAPDGRRRPPAMVRLGRAEVRSSSSNGAQHPRGSVECACVATCLHANDSDGCLYHHPRPARHATHSRTSLSHVPWALGVSISAYAHCGCACPAAAAAEAAS